MIGLSSRCESLVVVGGEGSLWCSTGILEVDDMESSSVVGVVVRDGETLSPFAPHIPQSRITPEGELGSLTSTSLLHYECVQYAIVKKIGASLVERFWRVL